MANFFDQFDPPTSGSAAASPPPPKPGATAQLTTQVWIGNRAFPVGADFFKLPKQAGIQRDPKANPFDRFGPAQPAGTPAAGSAAAQFDPPAAGKPNIFDQFDPPKPAQRWQDAPVADHWMNAPPVSPQPPKPAQRWQDDPIVSPQPPMIVQGPNGARVQFPAGTDPATVDRVMRENFGPPQTFAGKAADVAKSIAQGAGADALFGVLGLPGDIESAAGKVADWGARKIGGALGLPEPSAEAVAQANGMLRLPSSSDLHAAFNWATGESDYQPQTRAGDYARSVAAFVPQAILNGGAGGGNVVRNAVVPGLATEGAGQATRGTYLEPVARIAAALTAGGLANVSTLPNPAERALGRVANGLSNSDLDAAKSFVNAARARGIDITIPEAIDHLSNGATDASAVMRLLEMVPAGRSVTAPFFANRPGQVSGAVGSLADAIAPAADPAMVGVNAQRAASAGIGAARRDLNASTKALYDAAAPVVVPPAAFSAIATPAFRESLARLRSDPILGPMYAHLPDSSIGVLDAITKDLQAQATQASNSAAAGFNPQRAAILSNDADLARTIARHVSPEYDRALSAQAQGRANVLDPLEASPAGAIANSSAVPAQTGALFPAKPAEGAPARTADVVRMLEAQAPSSGAALVRQHLANEFAASSRDLQGGPNASGGARFASDVAGNPIQADNLRAGLAALPNGKTVAPLADELFNILRATGRRQSVGSLTASNRLQLDELGRVGIPGTVARSVADGNIARLSTGLADRWNQARISSRAADLANVLLGLRPDEDFARVIAARNATPTALQALTRAAGLASAAAR